MPARRQGRPRHTWNAEEGRRPCSYDGEHCSQYLQVCHSPNFTNYSQIFITTQKSPKNKSCSKSKVLQLCFYNHLLIRSTFLNANLKSKREYLKNHAFSIYFKFHKTTLKTPKTNFVQLDKLYIFALRLNPKMYFNFELGFSR